MAKQIINVGKSANDKSGDPIRTAFTKVNENFNELYSAIAADVQIPSQTNNAGKFLTTNGTILSWTTVSTGGTNTIGGLSDVSFGTAPTAGQGLVFDDNLGKWTNSTLGISNTGDITFNGIKVIGAGTASGDGLGYSTLELVPDGTLNTDQYIIVDPTTPNHIHLRAGGTQDASTAELYLGGERNNARINDYSGVKLNNNVLNSNTTRQFDITTDFTNATWSVIEPGVYYLMFRTSLGELQTVHDQFSSWPDNTIVVSDGTTTYTLTYNGYSGYLGNPNDRVIQVREAPPGDTTVNVQAMTFTIYSLQQNYVSLEYSGFEAVVNQDINLFSNQTIRIATGTGNIQITADDNNTSPSWYFTAQGYLQFPQGLGPTTSKGKAGDEAGSVVFDSGYIYYCTTDYTDGLGDIWKRVQWSADTW